MKNQPELFGKFVPYDGGLRNAVARHSDPETSQDAARSVEGSEATRMEAKVVATLQQTYSGMTTHEIAQYTGLSLVSVSPRIRPLCRKGLIEDSGERRMGASGRTSIVWRVKA